MPELTAEDRKFLQIIHNTPREKLEALFEELGILKSFLEAEAETEK